jgi:glycosyltransferase involved in cell wall biosynthesis
VLDYTPSENRWSTQNLILRCINHTNGIIALSSAQKINNKNKKIIPGVAPIMTPSYPELMKIDYVFLLSGILTKKRDPKLILDVFSKLPHYALKICGIVENEDMFIEYSKRYSNIQYYGFLPYNQYIDLLKEAVFCINSRDSTFMENHYNFPSKVIEYLLYNKIVVSTMYYPQLKGINCLYPNVGEAVFELFGRIQTIDKNLLLQKFANQSQAIIQEMGITRWSEEMISIEKNR